MRILIVCGAGASSTFVAQRLRRAASDSGLAWDIAAGTQSSTIGSDHDLVLVGPHLADRIDAITDATTASVALLPADVFTDRDGTRSLEFVRDILTADESTPKGTP